MRILSLHLPTLATDLIRRRETATGGAYHEGEPALLAPLVTVGKAKGAFRLVALDARARALGLKPAAALADARAMHPGLAVRPAAPAGARAALSALGAWCRRFTPLAAPAGLDGAVLDITGAAHLHGGESALAKAMLGRLAGRGFAARVAIAGTAGAAWALARSGKQLAIEADTDPAGRARMFAPLPLSALRLDETTLAPLAQAGLRRIGDLMLRPRAPIAARFGPEPHRRLDALLGLVREPISPRFPAPAFVAERRFIEGLSRREDVEGTILALAFDLCGLLARHGEGARRLHVSLFRVDGAVRHVEAGTGRPLRDPHAMARLFRERLHSADESGDGFDPGYGFEMVRLAALSAERLDDTEPMLDGGAGEGSRTAELADLLDRLGARFGLRRVVRLQIADAHRPEAAPPDPGRDSGRTPRRPRARSRGAALPVIALEDWASEQRLDTLPERPIRLLERPEPIKAIAAVPDGPPLRFRWRRVVHHVAAIEGPERIAPEWWARGSASPGLTRDYFRAEDTTGRRFWLFRDGLYREVPEPLWYVHGFFA